MAKQKSKQRARRDVATSVRPVPAGKGDPTPANVSTKAAAPPATSWAWTVGTLFVGVLLIGGAIFFLRDAEMTVATPQPAAVAEASTPTPAPTAPSRPAGAPPGIVDYCKRSPKFRETQGFSTRSVLSTAERGVKGAIMVEVDANGQVTRNYQHPSWDDAGYLGHVVLDRAGNIYAFPAPYVSLIDNPPALQNIIYRIDSATAEMTRFYTLTAPALPAGENPFGIMGLAYDCDTESLYASSVAGSTRAETLGQIVRLDLATHEVRFQYEGVDAFGVGLYIGPTGKRLYYGLARTPEIYSIGVDDAGDLLDDIRLEITLPDPTLKARRLIFAADGSLQVRSRPFDFNLIVTSDRPEVLFTYQFDDVTQQWQLVQPQPS